MIAEMAFWKPRRGDRTRPPVFRGENLKRWLKSLHSPWKNHGYVGPLDDRQIPYIQTGGFPLHFRVDSRKCSPSRK